jgi:hypothetical protein
MLCRADKAWRICAHFLTTWNFKGEYGNKRKGDLDPIGNQLLSFVEAACNHGNSWKEKSLETSTAKEPVDILCMRVTMFIM